MTDTAAARTEAAAPSLSITVDGKVIPAEPGELIIDAAERAGIFIPRFCYHPRMDPVGMCRMCLVEVSGPRGFSLQPACYLKVNDGLEVLTSTDKARKAQEGVLEFLLLNHPLDCPVCDKGGECPLQDQSVSHGPGETRFLEEKRHWAKPIDIGPLVALDRERCIQCARCTRFSAEIAGDAEIDFAERGDRIEVAPFPTKPFDSYFSGNTVQICPVGALTARPYRFKARPWDLEQVESTCTTCSVGCRHVAQSSAGQLVRFLGVDADPVNQSWLCDKGRFGFETLYASNRVAQPKLRRNDALVDVRWHEALAAVSAALRSVATPDKVAAIGGARLSNEDAYAWAKLLKAVVGTDSVDAQLDDGLPAETVLALPQATIDDACSAKTVILLTGDLREELPVLFLRLRDAVRRHGLRLIELSPVETALSPLAAVRLPYLPGESVAVAEALGATSSQGEVAGVTSEQLAVARGLIADGGDVVIVLGRGNLAESEATVAAAASSFASMMPSARFLIGLRRANVRGALDMGLAPGILPGRVSLDSPNAQLSDAWGETPHAKGRLSREILRAAADGEVDVLFLLGADPLADFPDRALASEALAKVPCVVALATHLDDSARAAQVVLPVVADGERTGTTTNLEGRVSRLAAKVIPPGTARAPWIVASELADRLGTDLGLANLESITEEIALVAPSHAGLTPARLAEADARDGLVVPLGGGSTVPPRPIDPIATPGIASVIEQGAPLRVGAATPLGGDATEEAWDAARAPQTTLSRPTERVVAPHLDAYSHRLVLDRRLYDEGTLVSSSPSLAPLASGASLRVHPSELAHLGLSSGDRVRVRSARGEAVLEAQADSSIARHAVAIRLSQESAEGADPTGLIDASALATDVRLETP